MGVAIKIYSLIHSRHNNNNIYKHGILNELLELHNPLFSVKRLVRRLMEHSFSSWSR